MEVFERERAKSGIDKTELSEFLYGDKERLDSIKEIWKKRKAEGLKKDLRIYEMSRHELIDHTIRKSTQQWFPNVFPKGSYIGVPYEILLDGSTHNIGSIGSLMVTKVLDVMATDAQNKKWLRNLEDRTTMACYAQTELAHGSDIQNLGTIATFCPKTQEFIFHTPDVGAIKWWPGDLGLFCTHALVYARLFSNGRDLGVLPFYFKIRDLETHIPLKGVELGDIGPKLGFNSKDNGFLKLTNFRVSKFSLLGKYQRITDTGDLKRMGNPKVMYAGMMAARFAVISNDYYRLMKGVVITTRYSLVRKQFKDTNGEEVSIMHYQTQKQKVLIQLCRALVMNASMFQVKKLIEKNDRLVLNSDFSVIKELHVNLCCMKVLFSEWATYGLSELIRACGGHGFSYYSGLPQMFHETFPDMILEGDSTILMLQVSKTLLKTVHNIFIKKKLNNVKGSLKYLKTMQDPVSGSVPVCKDYLSDPNNLIKIVELTSLHRVKNLNSRLIELIKQGVNPKDAISTKLGVQVEEMGRIHGLYTILKTATKRIRIIKCFELKRVYLDALKFFILNEIKVQAVVFMASGVIGSQHVPILQELSEEILERLTPHALTLCEGIIPLDDFLGSAIGHSNGKPYENLYNWAKNLGTLNRYENSVHPSIKKYWLPFRKSRERL